MAGEPGEELVFMPTTLRTREGSEAGMWCGEVWVFAYLEAFEKKKGGWEVTGLVSAVGGEE